MYGTISTCKAWDAWVNIDDTCRADVSWWLKALNNWNGTPLCTKPINIQIEMDASSLGWGAFLKHYNLEAAGSWTKRLSYMH